MLISSIFQVFDKIRTRWPDRLSKLYPITGDVSVPNLGVNADQRVLLRKVTTLFHSAATVRFTEPLAAAAGLNVQGTASLLQLAGDMPHLKVSPYLSRSRTSVVRQAGAWLGSGVPGVGQMFARSVSVVSTMVLIVSDTLDMKSSCASELIRLLGF